MDMDAQERDLDLALFSERLMLPLMTPAEIIDRLEQGVDKFVYKMQLINPGFHVGLIIVDRDTQDLMSRAGRLERRITKLETNVARLKGSDSGAQALEREISHIHARIDSTSGDLKQRLTTLAFRLVEMDMQVRLQHAPPGV